MRDVTAGLPVGTRQHINAGFAEVRSESTKKNNNRANGHGTAQGIALYFSNLCKPSRNMVIYCAAVAANNPPQTPTHRGPRRSPISAFGNMRLFVLLAKFIQVQLTVLFNVFLSVIISTPAGRCFSNKNLILLDEIILGHFFFFWTSDA